MRPTNTNEMQGPAHGRCRSATAVRHRKGGASERDGALANLPPMLRTVKWILAEPLIAIYVDGLDRVDDSSVYRTASWMLRCPRLKNFERE
jgi:hypothetical protein